MTKFELIIPLEWGIFDDILSIFKDKMDANVIKDYAWAKHNVDELSSFEHHHIGCTLKSDWSAENLMKWFVDIDKIKRNSIEKIKSSFKTYTVYLLHKTKTAIEQGKTIPTEYGGSVNFDAILEEYSFNGDVINLVDRIMNGQLKEYQYYSDDYKSMRISIVKDRKTGMINDAFNDYYTSCLIGADRKNKRQQLWIYGIAGSGKTALAKYISKRLGYSDDETFIVSSGKNPFDEYRGQPVIIIDDIDSDTMTPKQALKLADMFTNSAVSARYHNRAIIADVVIFTSTVSPYSWWKSVANEKTDGNIYQLYRRLNLGSWFINPDDYSIKINKFKKNGDNDCTVNKVLPIEIINKIKTSDKDDFDKSIDMIFEDDVNNAVNDLDDDVDLIV